MQIKFSEDVIPLSELKVNPGKIVNRAKNAHRPITRLYILMHNFLYSLKCFKKISWMRVKTNMS